MAIQFHGAIRLIDDIYILYNNVNEQILFTVIFEAKKRCFNYRNVYHRKLYHLSLFSYANWSPTWTAVSCASLHAAFISGSYQPEGRSAVKVGKLIGVPRRFTASSLFSLSLLPLFSPIPFNRFPTFRKVAAFIKRKTNNSVEIQWSCLFSQKLSAIFEKIKAIVWLALLLFLFFANFQSEMIMESTSIRRIDVNSMSIPLSFLTGNCLPTFRMSKRNSIRKYDIVDNFPGTLLSSNYGSFHSE